VDVLVNAVAITDRGTILDTEPELFDSVFAVNVRAPFFLMQDAIKVMHREGIQGSIVNIGWMDSEGEDDQSVWGGYDGSSHLVAAL
jgi:NAD(P)-dependent dehydrogenase (short-subunit alcohol dehydrogenase family)